MAETKKRLYNRSTLQRKLSELLKRVTSLNSGLDGTFEYLYYVKKLVVFGSYLDEAKDKMHDLDIGFELALKPKYSAYDVTDLEKARVETMPESFFSDSYGIMQGIWPTEEVLRYLKNKSGIYSFHPLDHKGEYEIIMSSKHKTVYDIDADGEKEKLHQLFEDDKESILYGLLMEKGGAELNNVLEEFYKKLRDIQIDLKQQLGMDERYTCDDFHTHDEAYQELLINNFGSLIDGDRHDLSNNIFALVDLENTISEYINEVTGFNKEE